VWSYGHRNVQGYGWDDEGRMWASELGQDTWDELNLIEPGNNHGWPVAEGMADVEGMIDPVAQWNPDDASPSGLAVVGTTVYIAGLKGSRLWVVSDPGGTASVQPVEFFTGEYGRLRDVVPAPDGTLWVLTNNTDGRGSPRDGDDRILQVKITP
jgi:glucose/arabinose dehydrogenase